VSLKISRLFLSGSGERVVEIHYEEAKIGVTIVGARVVDKLLGTINSHYTRAGDLCEFESELAPVSQLVQEYARRDCGPATQTGVFWTLLLSRGGAVGLFAQCLIDKPD
jgi:hypothetical protein